VGALTVDIGSLGADLVTAGGYKYLCSGFGISFCFVSPNLRESLEVSAPGWKSIKDAPFVEKQMQYNLRYPSDARRYEAAIPNLVGMYGLGATIDLFTNTGIQLINDWVLEISAGVAEVLEESGYVIANSIRDGERSGIVSAEVPGGDVKRVFEILAEQNIICAVRDNRLRFSCHVFNDWTDIERLASALPTP
jgi:selenocysteine lyase/cysteine desulfurase